MKYATIVSAKSEIDNPIPSVYFISPADGENPVEGQVGAFARIKFSSASHEGCTEADLIGILMHQMAAKAQDGKHRHLERAIQCLDSAMHHITGGKDVIEVELSPLQKMLTEGVQ